MYTHVTVECLDCGQRDPYSPIVSTCSKCGSGWREARYDYQTVRKTILDDIRNRPFDIWRFYELLPDVRSALQTARERIQSQYQQEANAYEDALARARASLEAMPEWQRLEDDDRAEIVERLSFQIGTPQSLEDLLNAYKAVLINASGLASRLQVLRSEVANLGALIDVNGGDENGEGEIEAVPFTSLRPETVISSESELDKWLKELKQRLLERLQAGKKIRLD